MLLARLSPLIGALLVLPACSKSSAAADDGGVAPSGSATALPLPSGKTPATAAEPATGADEALMGEDLESGQDEGTGGGAPRDEQDAELDTPSDEAASDVVIKNVGMRFGGGPNDGPSKEPTRKAIMAEFPRMRACHAKATGKRRFGTYGVDIRIGRDGGQARIGKPRTELKGAEFASCMKKTLEAIEFPKPPGGKAAMVSYSIRFEDGKRQ